MAVPCDIVVTETQTNNKMTFNENVNEDLDVHVYTFTKMETKIEKKVKNSLWQRLSSRTGFENLDLARIAERIRNAVCRLITCRFGVSQTYRDECFYTQANHAKDPDGGKIVDKMTNTDFRYPEDRFLMNSEISARLLFLEERFEKQSKVLKKYKKEGMKTRTS